MSPHEAAFVDVPPTAFSSSMVAAFSKFDTVVFDLFDKIFFWYLYVTWARNL